MTRRNFLLAALVSLCLPAWALAAPPMNVMRAQATAAPTAVKKNIDLVFRPKLVVKNPAGPVIGLAMSADERTLVTALGDRSLRLWDVNAGREVGAITGHGAGIVAVALSPDGKGVASVDSGGQVRVWDGAENLVSRPLAPISGPGGRVVRLAYLPGGRVLLGDSAGHVRLRDLASDRDVLVAKPVNGAVTALAASPDGALCVCAGADGGVAALDLATGAVRWRGALSGAAPAASAALDLDAKAGLIALADSTGRAHLWTLSDGRPVRSFEAGPAGLTAISLNAKTDIIATGDAKGAVRLFRASTGQPDKPLGSHAGAVTFLHLDAEGRHALSASADGYTRLWNVHGGTLLLTMISTREGWAIVDDMGRFDGSLQALTGIEWRDGDTAVPVSNFTEGYYEPALMAKRLREPGSVAAVQAIPGGVRMPARVEIACVDCAAGRNAAVVSVRGEDHGGSGVAEVRLYHNGRLVRAHGGEAGQGRAVASGGSATDEGASAPLVRQYEVPILPGENTFSAVAVNAEHLESQPAQLRLPGPRLAVPATLHVLTVGINKYRNPELDLRYAIADATSIREFFSTSRNLPFALVEARHVSDQAATKAGVLAMLRGLRSAPPTDTVVIYMAGHGIDLDNEWYFVPHDLEKPEPASIRAMGLSSRELRDEVEALGAARVFLAIDACHSGGAVSSLRDFQGMKSLRLLARGAGVHVLAATDRDQFAQEFDKLGHGVFTYSLLRGLMGEASAKKDGGVGVEEAMGFVEQLVPLLCRKLLDYNQYPTAHSRGAGFRLVEPH